MVRALVLLQTIAILALVVWMLRRVRPAAASRARLLGIGALLAAQALLLDGFAVGFLPALWRDGQGTPSGSIWLAQGLRALLLLPAFRLWYAVSRDALEAPGRRLLVFGALLAQAFGGGALPVFGLIALAWATGRPAWTQEMSGWRRLAILLLGPVLFLLLLLWPHGLVGEGQLSIQFAAFSVPWQGALIVGPVPPALATELALTRPLDRLVQALIDLFRAQLVALSLRALTLPLRLYGMSLKRRFTVNYVFVRSIPSVLGLITFAVVGYVAFGVFKAGQARAALERVLARADAAGAALLQDPRVDRGGTPTEAALGSARGWLGRGGANAHFLLRRWTGEPPRASSTEATPGTPPSLLGLALPARDASGTVEDRSSLYLFARRRDAADSSRTLDVFVPLDSVCLASVAREVGARMTLTLDRGVSSDSTRISFTRDTTGARRIVVTSSSVPGRRAGFFLGRSYLPLGDWGAGWGRGVHGAIALELRATGPVFLETLRDFPGWVFANVVMVGILLLLTTLIGVIEGVAVRSGRGIMRSIEGEVASLREAAGRFGAGELGHRIPVRGGDELSMLAGSFNEMAANLERQQAELIEKERLEEDLEVARSIQRRFLPQRAPEVPGLAVAGVSVPSREVGGDLFHYVELPGGRLGVALGDVSGKSVPAALIMSNVMSALRAEAQHEAEIERSLERINRLLVEQIEPGRFVTLFYGVVDPAANRLRYTSAGHNPVLRVSAAGEVEWLKEGGVPLGVIAEARYPGAEARLAPGDVLVAYSDGVTEAEGPGTDGAPALFGEERLARAVGTLRTRDPAAIVAGILEAVRGFAAGRPQADDITLVVLKRKESS